MRTIFVFILPLAILLFFIFFIVILYTILYNLHIRKKFEQGITTGKQWPSSATVVLSVIISLFAIYGLLTFVGNRLSDHQHQVSTIDRTSQPEVMFYTSDEIKGTYAELYADAFQTKKLAGYKMKETTRDNFHYVTFYSKEDYDHVHPNFILFIEYVGDKKCTQYAYYDQFYVDDRNSFGAGSYDNAAKYYCLVGNMNFEEYERYVIDFALYAEKGTLEKDLEMANEKLDHNLSSFAHASEKIEIEISE